MSLAKVNELIAERKEQYLEQLFTILRQKSISTQNIGIRECADLLREMMEGIGIKTRLMETKGHPVIYGEMIKDKDAFSVLIYGHYDVQPPDPLDEWLSPPFEPTIRNNKIYARGAGDNKGQLMAQLLAVKTYLDAFGELPINIKFIFEGEEEQSSANLPAFIQENSELLKTDLVYTSDGPSHDSGRPLILLGVRGVLKLELIAKGADWDNHSGNKGNIVPNPVWKLMDLFRTMRDEHGRVLIEGFYDHILPISEKDTQLLNEMPFDRDQVAKLIGYEGLNMDGGTYYRKLTMEPTFNICGIHSGYTGEGTKTIIPSKATVKMDIRLVADQDPQDIFEKFCNHVKKVAPDIEVKFMGAVSPSRTSAEHELVQVVIKAVGEAHEQIPIVQPSMGGSLPDYMWTKTLGLPSIVVPYANFDEANHSPNENIGVDYFLNGIKSTCHVIHKLGAFHQSGQR
ncbi:M20/M25/M40 family metallo-hydrolase [Paenibacillus sp. GP183]|uniref:M20/M25/M40 family metallo-hydrolase n=1 Tax=Paenibacillus sp. GP183 TaxID=1882751 RepID=UPI000899CD88|nr:M20/M25/M40 family metallo-hydrolase [Paenibacillus sp. GP183]SEC52313.1 Acetylornithine deacetylase/Succinyl-diaminopimelate desuccinylase [Paenibacillus sp. GP183]